MPTTDNLNELDVINPHIEDIMKKNLITFRKERSRWEINFFNPNTKNDRIKRLTAWDIHHKKEAYNQAVELYAKYVLLRDKPTLFDTHTLQNAINEYLEEHPNEERYLKPVAALLGHKGLKQITYSA